MRHVDEYTERRDFCCIVFIGRISYRKSDILKDMEWR